ncbi:hypothetical protein SK571_21405 [Lentzea sp. BCCO 10_0798]|jgi:hypothetical protein|uniref:Uncharacterized protein n=1 Tax=Lentzea kristufekii TaxID=3095430 RepID=A0ABU4TV55_9PSEU|nr:hypothetical protein [Lentzea sp. BCCO 10_0798]MDX8051958.1 hypothetical protein [Lentzea sp. BCCO 10_0798]
MLLAEFVELAEMAGARIWLKMDGERATHRWTVIISSAQADFRHRRDVNRLDHVLKIVRDELAKLPGDWSWLHEPIDDLNEVAEFYEERGRAGEIVIIDRPELLL